MTSSLVPTHKKKWFLLRTLLIVSLGCKQISSAQTVYINKTGKKYHTDTCHYLKNSKKEITLEEAINSGYQACSVCRPNQNAGENTEANAFYGTTKNPSNAPKPTHKATATQCTGKTKSGNRCRRMTKDASGRCYQH